MNLLYKFDHCEIATCTARPSKTCKSPYVADIVLNGTTFLAHTPALGMDGYVSPDRKLLVAHSLNPKGTCKYSVLASYDSNSDIYVGANPLHANKAFHQGLKLGLFETQFGHVESITPEYCPDNSESRFDFKIIDNQGKVTYVEVKSVLIARNNVGIFPVGNKKNGTVSERANKHVTELTTFAKSNVNTAVVFMVLRDDVTSFAPNKEKDPLFAEILTRAYKSGVNIFAFQCAVNSNGIFYKGTLPVHLES